MSGRNVPNYRILTARFASSGQWDRTLETAREWLSVEPENIEAHRAAGEALVFLDRKAEGEPHIRRVLAARPGLDEAHRLMSLIHFKAGRFKAADESVRKAISLNPRSASNWYQLGRMCYLQGDYAAASKFAAKALELAPRDPDITNLVIMSETWDQSNTSRSNLTQQTQGFMRTSAFVISTTLAITRRRKKHFAVLCFLNPLASQPAPICSPR
jgi:tetratricopeptide (TPR) repeat protein